jgi:hypothetical protein
MIRARKVQVRDTSPVNSSGRLDTMVEEQGGQLGEWGKGWGKLIARAWADEGLKKRLLADPAQVLKENGLEVPPGVQVKVVEDTESLIHLTLPAKPTSGELSEEELSSAAGGYCHHCGCGDRPCQYCGDRPCRYCGDRPCGDRRCE